LAWPSSLLERSEGSRLPGGVSETPEPVRRICSRFQKLKRPPAKDGKIENGIETARAIVAWVCVTGSEEAGNAVTNPIVVVRKFRGGHLRVDGNGFACDGIESIFADGLKKRMCEINALMWPLPSQPK